MISQQAPFLQDSPIEPLSPTHIDLITQAGLQAPYRKFGQGWPFFVSASGNIAHTIFFAVCRIPSFPPGGAGLTWDAVEGEAELMSMQMQGEGGIQACPVGSTHRNGPKDPLSKDHLK